jgi:hypothetical protein
MESNEIRVCHRYSVGDLVFFDYEDSPEYFYGTIKELTHVEEKGYRGAITYRPTYLVEIDDRSAYNTYTYKEKLITLDEHSIRGKHTINNTPIENMTVGRLLLLIDKRMFDNMLSLSASGSVDVDYYGRTTGYVTVDLNYRPYD